MRSFFLILLGLFSLALLALGGWLMVVGGSFAYLLLGLALMVSVLYLARGRPAGLHIFALTLLVWLGFAVWEVGFDWWQLMPRGAILSVFALALLLPAVRRSLFAPRHPRDIAAAAHPLAAKPERGMEALPLAIAVILTIGVALYSMTSSPQRRDGVLPGPRLAEAVNSGNEVPDTDWHQYGRTEFGQRFSPLEQITPQNISQLTEAWRYQTGDVKLPEDVTETTYQVTPLKVGERLFLCTPHNIAIALDAKTGAELWRFDANSGMESDRQHQTCRGVSYWSQEDYGSGADALPSAVECQARVYMPTADARLIALDAASGEVCKSFADNGELHLEAGMPYNPAGYYYSTSPPIIAGERIIIGGAVNDNFSTQSPSGVIRAFDVLTGELLWNWDAGNPDQTAPIDIAAGERYTANSPNSWSVFSLDRERGLVFIPLGNQVPDQLGMGRSDAVEAHSSSVVALDIATGQKRWVFQTVHHDLWDMDVPAQPVLVDLTVGGATVPALVAPTKQGDIYVLNRETGEPILPVTERPAPSGAIDGDFTAPTQPTSKLSFEPPPLREADMWGLTIFDQIMCRIRFNELAYEGRYTPPSLGGTLVYPGNFGVFNWGSVAVDPERQVMFGMPTRLAFTSRLVPRADIPPKGEDEKASEQGLNRNDGADYGVFMGAFLGPLGVPCQAPPWGFIAGADLTTGEIVYMRKNGTVIDMTPLPIPFELGVPGIGGPMITKGGVAFLSAAVDNYLRGYDLSTGAEIWRARLPAGGQATPMSYAVDGQQYLLIVAGGHGSIGTKPGDYVIAYRLADAR